MKNLVLFFIFVIFTLALNLPVKASSDVAFYPYEPHRKETILSEISYKYNSLNPTVFSNRMGSMYPGFRGSNQMVIYTSKFGKSTGTNEFGSEAIIVGNTVVSMSGADSLIPKNGLVISAHGRAKNWLNTNLFVGAKVYINEEDKILTVYTTSDSYLYCAKEKINEASALIDYYKKKTPYYDELLPMRYVARAKLYLKKAEHNSSNVVTYSKKAVNCANSALANALPYNDNELKGIWVRPDKTTEDGIKETLDAIKKAGIDNVFLETYFHGKTIYPSSVMKKYGFNEQNEYFQGFDPLQVWISEAHKRNIKVHIWFETFYVGNKAPKSNPKNILAVKPQWANINKKSVGSKNIAYSVSEHNGYFIDPANPEVREFVLSLLNEIITIYRPDGINLDYIRYPQSVQAGVMGYEASNWGYTPFAREEFQSIYDIDPVNLTYSDLYWANWSKYRQDKITSFVREVSRLCGMNNTFLSAVIFPNRANALTTKQQDWSYWSRCQYIDAVTPLFLTCDTTTVSNMIKGVLNNLNASTKLYAGLFIAFMGGSEEDMLKQIHETRKQGLGGVILFDYAHLESKYVKTLNASVFNPNRLPTETSHNENFIKKIKFKRGPNE